MNEYKQYFYLIVRKSIKSDGVSMAPEKITLQSKEAIRYGRRLATVLKRDPENKGTKYEVRLYRQLIAKNGLMEFIDVLKPFDDNSAELKSEAPKDNTYLVHWRLDLTPTIVKGETIAIALEKSGYGGKSIIDISKIENIEEEDYIETPNHEFFLLKNKKVKSIITPRKVNDDGSMWLTGIEFKDEPSQIKFYKTEELCRLDHGFLVIMFKQGSLNK